MATDWDPTPGRVGLDWPVIERRGVRIESTRACIGVAPSTATETIGSLRLPFERVINDPTIIAEVYNAADIASAVATATFQPNEDVAFPAGLAGAPTDTAGNRYTNLDETTPSDSDYVAKSNNGTSNYDLRFNTAAGLTGTPFVTEVRLKFRAKVANIGTSASIAVSYNNDNLIAVHTESWSVNTDWTTYTVTMPFNPATEVPWTEQDIIDLDGASDFFRLALASSGAGVGNNLHLSWVSLEVDYATDKRLAHGSAVISADGWATFTLNTNVAKASGSTYAVLVRRTSADGSAVIPLLDSGASHPASHRSYELPTMYSSGRVVEAVGDASTAAMPIIWTTTAPATSGDSMPYVDVIAADVDASNTPVQEITRPSTATVGWGVLVARSQRKDVVPSAPLLVKVKNGAGTQQGGTIALGPELVADAPYAWHVLDGTMASAVSLTSGTQYKMELSSLAVAGEGWEVVALDANAAGESAGFGGTTDAATIGSRNDDYDIAIVQGTVPTAPSNFAAAASTAGEGSVNLSWTATVLGGSFSRYVIERLDPDLATWRVIAHETTEATASYVDETARRGVEEVYRIRVRHTNGTVSLPSATANATLTLSGSFLIFPESPSLSRGVGIRQAGLTFAYPRDRVESMRYGNRFPTVTEFPTDRGIVITGTVNLDDGSNGLAEQASWTRTVKDDTTYAVLVTGYGERWIVSLQFTDGVHLVPSLQQIGFRAVEITDVPIIVES